MKRNKLIKELSLGIVSLGLLVGIGNIGSGAVDASSNDISQQDLNQIIAETDSEAAQTEANDIKIGVKQDAHDPSLAAYSASYDPSNFEAHKDEILPHYNKAQMKEFISDFYVDAPEGWTIDAKGNIHKSSNHKKTRKPKKVIKHNNHKRARKPRKKVTKHVNKKHAIRKHRTKRIKRVARKHTTHKARNYNYLGTYRQGFNQARRDYHNSGLINSSDKNLFNHLIRNRKFKSSKYFDGYTEEFRHMAINDEDSDFGDSYTLFISYIQEYLRGNNITKRAISDFYIHNKPNHYLMKHNHQYKKVYNNIYLA